jgi:hypothetical protein
MLKKINFRNIQKSLKTNTFFEKQTKTRVENKPIIIKKQNYEAEDDYFEHNYDTSNNSEVKQTPLATQKWMKFFNQSQSKILPYTNLAIKQQHSSELNDFVNDQKRIFDDNQSLFYYRNVLLNADDINLSISLPEVYSDIVRKCLYSKSSTFNASDKNSVIGLAELLYLLPEDSYNVIFKIREDMDDQHNLYNLDVLDGFINKCDNGLRNFVKALNLEESLFCVKTLLEKGYYDSFLVENIFKKYSDEEIMKTMDGAEYMMSYYNTKIDLKCAILMIIDKMIHHSKSMSREVSPDIVKLCRNLLNKVYIV